MLARDATPDSLKLLAKRCRQVITETAVHVRDGHVKPSVSLGRVLLEKGESSTNAFIRADQLLYVDKCDGKSRPGPSL